MSMDELAGPLTVALAIYLLAGALTFGAIGASEKEKTTKVVRRWANVLGVINFLSALLLVWIWRNAL